MEWERAYDNSRSIKGQITREQSRQLFKLCSLYNQDGAYMLDIGTFHGYSASIMAQAAPRARILTINPVEPEVFVAKKNLKRYKNVKVQCIKSWDLLELWDDDMLDFIFVDGDHNRVAKDLGWYEYLVTGGLMLFHDWNPEGCGADSPILKRVLLDFIRNKKRDFDYILMDEERQRGMVGILKQEENA